MLILTTIEGREREREGGGGRGGGRGRGRERDQKFYAFSLKFNNIGHSRRCEIMQKDTNHSHLLVSVQVLTPS